MMMWAWEVEILELKGRIEALEEAAQEALEALRNGGSSSLANEWAMKRLAEVLDRK